MSSKVNIHWFRRDLRLEDNTALSQALQSGNPVICIFIFDRAILDELAADDARVGFIHERLTAMHEELKQHGSGLVVLHGQAPEMWEKVMRSYDVETVFTNRDYEPYALTRDKEVTDFLEKNGATLQTFKDQVIFEPGDVLKADGTPYTVYTPYSKKCIEHFDDSMLHAAPSAAHLDKLHQFSTEPTLPTLKSLGFNQSEITVRPYSIAEPRIAKYDQSRDFPAMEGTSDLSPHLRFGSISVRQAMKETYQVNHTFAKELFWREFFMQILFHFPHVVKNSFRAKYDRIVWRNDEKEFKRWCAGQTGYPMVDAGMRELNETGYMHNRVRMVVASFLCKHLLIDWRWGEAYFAEKLLDFELASNNGNWQWAAGTGCDAAPYFRVFNPTSQMDKFDKARVYIKKWIPEFDTDKYAEPMVEHKMARERALATYKEALAMA